MNVGNLSTYDKILRSWLITVFFQKIEVSVPKESWVDSGYDKYPYKASITDNRIKSSTMYGFQITSELFDVLQLCGMYPNAVIDDGKITFYAVEAPSTDFKVDLYKI